WLYTLSLHDALPISELLPTPYSIDHMAGQILDLLINDGIREFHFIGHALGGHIGMQLATYQAERKFKLLSLTMLNAWGELDAHRSEEHTSELQSREN